MRRGYCSVCGNKLGLPRQDGHTHGVRFSLCLAPCTYSDWLRSAQVADEPWPEGML